MTTDSYWTLSTSISVDFLIHVREYDTALQKQDFIFSECLNCTKFDQLILRKLIKIVATRCHILRLKCTKFDFGWGSAPDPTGGAHSAPPDPLAGFKGPTSKGRGADGG